MAGNSMFVLVSNKWSNFLYGNLDVLRTEGVLCDVTLQGNDGKTQLAHSCVLASASSVLKSCLIQAPRGHYVVKIPSITTHMWDLLINFIYQGKVKVTAAEREEMLTSAQMLGLAELQGLCEANVTTSVPTVNMSSLAVSYSTSAGGSEQSELPSMPEVITIMDDVGAGVNPQGELAAGREESHAGQDHKVTTKQLQEVTGEAEKLIFESEFEAKNTSTKYTCTQCGKSFPWGKALHVHELMHKQKKGLKHTCGQCSKVFSTYHSLRAHERTHTYQPFKCKICNSGFHFQVNYELHMKKEHNVESNEKYNCSICQKNFIAKGLLHRHMSMAHGLRKTAEKKPNLKTVKMAPICFCHECDLEFQTRNACKEHFMDLHKVAPFYCEVCDHAFESEERRLQHYKVHGTVIGDPVRCSVCDTPFKHKYSLKIHETEVHGVPNDIPKCKTCGLEVKTFRLLAKHMRTHEGQVNDSLWLCKICNASFDNRSDFSMHVAEHRGERTYMCKYCNKGFTHKGNYTTHMQRHLGIKPFICQYCKKTFVRKDDLKSHLRVHTGEKPFDCQVCKMKFSCISNLREHERAKHNTTFSKRNPTVTVPRQHRQRVKYRAKNVAQIDPNEDCEDIIGLMTDIQGVSAKQSVKLEHVQNLPMQNMVIQNVSEGEQMFTVPAQQGELGGPAEYYQVVEDSNGVQTLAPFNPQGDNPVIDSTAPLVIIKQQTEDVVEENEGQQMEVSTTTSTDENKDKNEIINENINENENIDEENISENEIVNEEHNKHDVQTDLALEAEEGQLLMQ